MPDGARCPFLREAQVKFCRASVYQKFIVRSPDGVETERCSSREYVSCPAARRHQEERPSHSRCPFLCESLVQYCAATPVTKYVPYTESGLTRCGNASHRYCEVYVSLAEPEAASPSWIDPKADGRTAPDGEFIQVDHVRMPKGLAWTPNHMWLDEADDGTWHVGVDEFLTFTLGGVDEISFPMSSGQRRPTVVLRANGVDLPMIFPEDLLITGVNLKVRYAPGRMISDPYRTGWLFEGHATRNPQGGSANAVDSLTRGSLMHGPGAEKWMRSEIARLAAFAHEELVSGHGTEHGDTAGAGTGPPCPADGGGPVSGIARALGRESLLRLFDQFFAPSAGARSRP